MAAIFHIKDGNTIRRGTRKHLGDDEELLELFSSHLLGRDRSQVPAALQEGIPVDWKETYDIVNPFGDRRGSTYESSWIFDLVDDSLTLIKRDRFSSVSLSLALERQLSLSDFESVCPPDPTAFALQEGTFPSPYRIPKLDLQPRVKQFLGQIVRDFAFVWRHVVRRRMTDITFKRLAYGIIRILTLDFRVEDRTDFDHSPGGPYVWLEDLPTWEAPDAALLRAGRCWIALSQDAQDGLRMIQTHIKDQASTSESSANKNTLYAIFTLRHIILCNSRGGELTWSRPEPVLDGEHPPSDRALNMLLWATKRQPRLNALNIFPPEVQDAILIQATRSSVSAAKLGCELDIGSPYSWFAGDSKVEIEEVKRRRTEFSPVESQIWFDDIMSGISYKPQRKQVTAAFDRPPWPLGPTTPVNIGWHAP